MTPFIGQIMEFGGNFAPVGWALCNGQLMPISQNEALFALIGTTYGGDGVTTFALPDLRGRVPMHMGNGFSLGQVSGTESVTLLSTQLPVHTHVANCSDNGTTDAPAGAVWAKSTNNGYSAAPGTVNMNAASVGAAGSSAPHDNMHPFLAVTFVIALEGIFPSQN